jgi:hypothetical protein
MKEKVGIMLATLEPNDLLDESTYSDTSNPVIPSLLAKSIFALAREQVQAQCEHRF